MAPGGAAMSRLNLPSSAEAQTAPRAALELTPNLPKAMKHYHLAKGVGHYGIFNGSKWRTRIAPVLEDWITKFDAPAAQS